MRGPLWVGGQPGLQSEFLDSQGFTEKPCLEKKVNKPKMMMTRMTEDDDDNDDDIDIEKQ